MPIRARRYGAIGRSATPPSVIVPARAGSAPTIARTSVVLPAPFRPMTPQRSPVGTWSDTAGRIGVAPMLTSRRWTSSTPAPRHVLAHARVAEDVGGRAVGQDAALVEREHAPAVALDDVDVVLDEDDGGLPLGERGHDDVHHGELLLGGDAAGRLVEEEQRGLARRGHRDVEELPHALRDDGRRPVAVGLDAIDAQELRAGLHAVTTGQGRKPGAAPAVGQAVRDHQVFEDRHRREDLGHLERAAHTEPGDLARREADELLAAKTDRASARVRVTGDEVDERRLARAVGADDGDDLLGRDGDVDVAGGHDLIEQLRESAHLQHRRARHARARFRSSADQSPPGRYRMIASSATPRIICQTEGAYWSAYVWSSPNTSDPRNGARTLPVPLRIVTNTSSPEVVQ